MLIGRLFRGAIQVDLDASTFASEQRFGENLYEMTIKTMTLVESESDIIKGLFKPS